MRDTLGRVLKLLTRKPARAAIRHEAGPYAVPMLQAAQSQTYDRAGPNQPQA
jgi:hypothetical protein